MSNASAVYTDNPADDIEQLAEKRETLERLAAADLPISSNVQIALDYLDEYETSGDL